MAIIYVCVLIAIYVIGFLYFCTIESWSHHIPKFFFCLILCVNEFFFLSNNQHNDFKMYGNVLSL